MTEVYFLQRNSRKQLYRDFDLLYERAFSGLIDKDDITAVKVHFGEYGNKTYIKPVYIKKIVKKIKENKANPFVTDSNALYKGMRHNSLDHLENARLNGFTFETLDAPVIIADGMHGHNFHEVEINKNHFNKVKIAAEIYNSNSIIFASHFKGHMTAGFGGAIKNIAMGCASRAGKQQQHSSTKPEINKEICINCKNCNEWCPEDAIRYNQGFAVIDYEICVGCSECVAACKPGAIGIKFDSSNKDFQEKLAEYAFGAVLHKKTGFINFLIDITKHCDCFDNPGDPVIDDIGILAGIDPVAVDLASYDLVKKANSNTDIFEKMHGIDSTIQLNYAEDIGLGKKSYKIIKV
ncbi:DUF362 domain-containing protein [Candidatus Woesearchaeota archaeon]|nr:DUF362 domain-containing protein [Candidatus Woesearchaeota archaeon]